MPIFFLLKDRAYIYPGDRGTADSYKGQGCKAVRNKHGKCIRGKNGNMLVSFGNTKVIVQARLLRKIKAT